MKDLEKVLKALANKRRLMILKYLKKTSQASVTDIAKEIKLSFKSISRHLAVLLAAEILEKDQKSTQMFYKISLTQKAFARYIVSII